MKLELIKEPLSVTRRNAKGDLIEQKTLECYAFGSWRVGSYFNRIKLPKNSKQGSCKNIRVWSLVDSSGKTVFSAEKMYWVLNFAKTVEYAREALCNVDDFIHKLFYECNFTELFETMGVSGELQKVEHLLAPHIADLIHNRSL